MDKKKQTMRRSEIVYSISFGSNGGNELCRRHLETRDGRHVPPDGGKHSIKFCLRVPFLYSEVGMQQNASIRDSQTAQVSNPLEPIGPAVRDPAAARVYEFLT